MIQTKLSPGYRLLAIFLAWLTTLAILGNPIILEAEKTDLLTCDHRFLMKPLRQLLSQIPTFFPDTGLSGIVVHAALLILYWNFFSFWEQRTMPRSKLFFVISAIFALFILFGISFQNFGSLAFLLQGSLQIIYAFLFLIGLTTLFYVVCTFLLSMIGCKILLKSRSNRLADFLLDKRPILTPFCSLLLCWLPYWFACFPGSVAYDMNYQWSTFLGYIPMSGHHPVFSTMLYGYLLKFTRIFFNDTICLALIVLIQYLALAACITYGLHCMRRWKVPQNLRLFALLFFALNPLIPIWLQLLVKDCIYFSFFFTFSVSLLNLIIAVVHHHPIGKPLISTMFWSILVSLMRNNGIHIVVPSFFLVLMASKIKEQKIMIGVSAIITAIVISLTSHSLLTLYDASEGPLSAMMSIPFQQTARYVSQYAEELTPEERSSLGNVLNVDILPQVYDPNISDPVLGTVAPGYEKYLNEYLNIWAEMFCKHPMSYLEATLHNTYAYLSPIVDSPTAVIAAISIDKNPYPVLDAHYLLPDSARTLCLNILLGTKQLPIIGLFIRVGTFTWVLILLVALSLYHKQYYLCLGCIPAVMNLLVCIASPVNGYYRYALPHMLVMPVLLGWVLTGIWHSFGKEENE